MINGQYTIKDVLEIIEKQLDTIPVCGQHARTMAAVYSNVDALIELLTKKSEEVNDDGGTV